MTDSQVIAVLEAIDSGEVSVTPDCDPHEQYCGIVVCTAGNGWKFGIFNDCDKWDYVQWIETPTGEHIDPWTFLETKAFDRACNMASGNPEREERIRAASQPEWEEVRSWRPRNDGKRWGW